MIFELKFNYNNEKKNKIHQLKKLLQKDDDLFVGCEEVLLTKFLNFADWNVAKSYKCIQRYYDFKAEHPEWFTKHSVEYFRPHFLETKTRFLMDRSDKNGCPIVVIKSLDAFGRFPNYFQDIIEMDDLIFEALLLLPRTQKFGITVIFDLNGMSYNFIRMLSPTFARLINEKNSILPYRHRSVHIIQNGIIMATATAIILPFIASEYKDYIYTHSGNNFEKLHDMLGYENVPADYGGPKSNKLDENLLFNFLQSNASYLRRLQKYQRVQR